MNPISKYLLAGFLFILIFAGVLPSIIHNDWSWFGRSGSLITAYGIAITFFDVAGFMDSSIQEIGAKIDTDISKMDLSKVPKEKLDQYEEYKNTILTGISKSIRRLEFFILFVGTIIWGYGDLLFE